ncbi:MAG: SLC26A/SulP transporter family protein [Anaerolineales bacterium]|nr:SLC26A/SulP transporter family protein [Anaerolineales bacterium]
MNAVEFKRNFQPSVLLPSLTAGLINAVILISVEISLAVLIFSGDLSPFLPRGIGMMLVGTVIVTIVIALTSSLVNMVGVPQDTPAALMALMSAGVAATLKGQEPEAVYSTVVGAIMLGSLLTGILFIILGRFKLSGFARYVPYPVVGGFLAGTGYLLVKGAFGVMADIPQKLANIPMFFAPSVLWNWLPGILFGLALLFILRRFNHFLITPGAVIAGAALFYLYLAVSGISIEQAGANGWLLGPFPEGGLFQFFTLENLGMVQWSAIFGNAETYATLFGLSVISLLLNASGLEVIYKQDIDLNRELVSAGGANILGGLIGFPVGYQTLGFTALPSRFGAKSRLVGISTGLFCALALFLGASFISYFPRFVMGGMLFFLGLSFLAEWLVDSYKLLPRMDYVLIWVMLIIIDRIGFLEAIGAGIVISSLLFVVSYGNVSVIKNMFSGATLHSRVERSQRNKSILSEKGRQIHILSLQGFIFFGSIQRVLENVRARMLAKGADEMKFLVVDFRQVKRLDSSAVFGVTRLKQLTESSGVTMIWSDLDDDVLKQMKRGDLLQGESDTFSIQPTLDHALEWCENKILASEKEEGRVDFAKSVLTYMKRSFPGIQRVKEYMERVEIQTGEYFIKQGDPSNDLFFIESGLVTVEFEMANGNKMRLRSVKSGATLGEVTLYLGGLRSASVKAEQPSTVYRLSAKNLKRMQKDDPALAVLLHEWIARTLAERLAENNRLIELFFD